MLDTREAIIATTSTGTKSVSNLAYHSKVPPGQRYCLYECEERTTNAMSDEESKYEEQ